MRSYPIWNNVQASRKSWGAKQEASVNVVVGTSAQNSHDFVSHKTTHRTHDDGTQEFRFYVDGVVVKRAVIAPQKLKRDCQLEFVGAAS